MIVYFLSGLGADERAFEKISLPDGYEMQHIPWEPVKGYESIDAYAKYLSYNIDTTKPFMLAGLSLGGLVAIEISKIVEPELLILFSTIHTQKNLPAIYRIAGKLRLYKFLHSALLSVTLPFLYWFFGPVDNKGRQLIASFLKQTDPVFLKWAIKQISRWENIEIVKRSLQIHGSKDRTFPVSLIKPDYIIEGGGHFCVFTHASEINSLLKKELR